MELHEYQKRCANFIAQHPHCILSVDMGLGKTAAVLAWLDWAERRAGYKLRGYIIAPKRVAENQWKQEAEKWGLSQLADRMVIVATKKGEKNAAEKRAQMLADNTHPVKIISRDFVGQIAYMPADFVILDELTSYKSVTAARSKCVRSIQAPVRVGLTGTFLANGAIDIYGQCAAVGLKFGDYNFYAWRATFFRDALAGSGLQFQKWQLCRSLEDLLQPVKKNIFTLTSADYLQIPPVTETTHRVQMSEETREAIADLDAFLSLDLNGETLAFDEAQKFAKLQTLCDGFVYMEDGTVKRGKESAKLDAVADFVADCKDQGEPVLLFYAFREEATWLAEKLKARGVGLDSVKHAGFLERWNNRQTDCLLAHPASAGHGLNLQHGGRVIVWSTLSYNYEYFAQSNARLARQGQRQNVQIHYFIAAKTCEERAVKALQTKDKEQKQFLTITKQ